MAGHYSRRSDPLARALAELSSDERQVLLLRFGQHLEVAAIAELLGLDDDRVRRPHLRALRALRLANA
jgi:RNA polymerase sigma factor (sigma-70 family)